MNGYMYFLAGHTLSARAEAQPRRQDHPGEPLTSGRAIGLGLLLPLATLVTTYAALTG